MLDFNDLDFNGDTLEDEGKHAVAMAMIEMQKICNKYNVTFIQHKETNNVSVCHIESRIAIPVIYSEFEDIEKDDNNE